MVSQDTVSKQLTAIKTKFTFFGRAGVRELANVLAEDETIKHCLFGSYQGGTAVIVATDKRLLIIDKKPLFLNLEDVRYHAMTDIHFSNGVFTSSMKIVSGISTTEVRSLSVTRLRNMCMYVQDRVFSARGENVIDNALQVGMLTRAKASQYSGRVLLKRHARQYTLV